MVVDTKIIVDNLVKVVGTSDPLRVQVKGVDNSLVDGVQVTFTVNGVSYNRTTDINGYCSLPINLNIGTYTCTVYCHGDSYYNPSTASVTVQVRDKYSVSIMVAGIYTKTYGESGAVTAIMYQEGGVPAKGLPCRFTINGIDYNRTSDSNGEIRLNINLRPGEYDLKTSSLGDATHSSVDVHTTVRVKSNTRIVGSDMVKMEGELKVYECSVLDCFNDRLTNVNVHFTVNGVSYTRLVGNDGVARLNIRLGKGEYDLKVEYYGSTRYNPSSTSNHITSKPYMQSLTTVGADGLTYPGNNIGFMQSHIHCMRMKVQTAVKKNIMVLNPRLDHLTGNEANYDIPFMSYEITETDPRVKTAKFTTDRYMDLTTGRYWVYITSPYHENFGGQILKVDYDKDKGLYTYQCQDGRRQYMTKFRDVGNTNNTIYDYLEKWLIFPTMIGSSVSVPLSKEVRANAKIQELLSGLHPIEDYDNMKFSPALKAGNKFKEPIGEFLSFDSLMDKIMNFSHIGQVATDVYFTPDGICHIDPVDFDVWLKTGFKLTHSDLVQYKYGFDTTNIISAVGVKSNSGDMKWYGDGSLQWYFGYVNALIDPVTTQTTTESTGESTSSSAGSHKGKTVVVACDTNTSQDSNFLNTTINKLKNAGYTVENLGIGPGAFSRYDWSGKSKGKVGVFIIAASTVAVGDAMSHQGFDYVIFGIRGDIPGTRAITGWNNVKWGRDADCNSACNGWAGLTSQQISDKMGSHGCLVPGNNATEMANNILAAVNGNKVTPSSSSNVSSGGEGNQTQTTTVMDEVATYQKALDEMAKSVRDLLSFEIRLPLNDPMFKELHTNQFLWTELPREFELKNLTDIFKILPSYKVNRGVPYQENRWYIEKQVIKCDSNGLFSTLTLNPFPSSYSVYSNAVKGYLDAYNQAFKQQEAANSTGTSSAGAGQARLGKDSTDTNSMRCMSGGGYGNAGTGKNFDSCSQKGYAQQGRKYYEWARQYNDPLSLAKALAKRFSYKKYSNNRDANAEVTHNNGGTIHCNCYDACRLVKCCFDAAGLDCVVITGNIYGFGHGWNAVKYNGQWYSFDLCFEYTAGTDQKGSNALRKFF